MKGDPFLHLRVEVKENLVRIQRVLRGNTVMEIGAG